MAIFYCETPPESDVDVLSPIGNKVFYDDINDSTKEPYSSDMLFQEDDKVTSFNLVEGKIILETTPHSSVRLPADCYECPFCAVRDAAEYDINRSGLNIAVGVTVLKCVCTGIYRTQEYFENNYQTEARPSWCPLVEVEVKIL